MISALEFLIIFQYSGWHMSHLTMLDNTRSSVRLHLSLFKSFGCQNTSKNGVLQSTDRPMQLQPFVWQEMYFQYVTN